MNTRALFHVGIALAGIARFANAQSNYLTRYSFTTLAGSASVGSVDGPGNTARFQFPSAVAVDRLGNIYVADSANYTVRKISTDGTVTTLAGKPHGSASIDGAGGNAQFISPHSLAVDAAGNILVADGYSLRRISVVGEVTTLAGAARTSGSTDGPGVTARFQSLTGLAVDATGNIIVADQFTIRKVTAAGVVSTVAGTFGTTGSADGTGGAARFNNAYGVAIDPTGNIVVADAGNSSVRKITPAGIVSTLGHYGGFTTIAIDSAGVIYLAGASSNASITKITTTGVASVLAGSPGTSGSIDGPNGTARFYDPRGLAVDSGGNLYVADLGNNGIRKITPGGTTSTLAGLARFSLFDDGPSSTGASDGNGSAARFSYPVGVAVASSGEVYVSDSGNSTIRKITAAGVVSTFAGSPTHLSDAVDGTGSAARFDYPQGIALAKDGTLFVADNGSHTIRKITPAGVVTTIAGSFGRPGYIDSRGFATLLNHPQSVAVDAAGNVYVTDSGNGLIRRITANGVIQTLAGQAGRGGSSDGPSDAASFILLQGGIAVDAAGNCFVVDAGNYTIRKITPAGVVSTVAGLAGQSAYTDGVGRAARFYAPRGVAIDGAGNLYVTDFSTIRMVTPEGAVSTIGGLPSLGTSAATPIDWDSTDGAGNAARFSTCQGIAVDAAGSLFVADAANNTIRKGSFGLSRLLNLSILTELAKGETMTMGTVLGGAGTSGAKPLLVRAAGPALAQFGIPVFLPKPTMTLTYTSAAPNRVVATASAWGGSTNLSSAFVAVGAFPYTSTASQDSAIFQPSLVAGDYTVQVTDTTGGAGSVISELYDSTPNDSFNASTPRLVNVSVLKQVGKSLSAGLVVGGSGTKTVLVRAIGPTLGGAPFNVGGVIADPQLVLFDGKANVVASNGDWGTPGAGTSATAAQLSAAFAQVGAFGLPAGSKDAALLTTLAPGNYTAQVTGANGVSGVALVEVYEVP